MKLYTEQQLETAIMTAYIATLDKPIEIEVVYYMLMNELTPIELPSDEEIEEMGKDVIVYNDTKRGWFVEGLKFMRDKIQGGNK